MGGGVSAHSVFYEVGGHRLLTSVSVEIGPGRLGAIVGPSGAGKSTLLKVLCGIKRPDRGRVVLAGSDPRETQRSAQIGYVPQDDIVHRTLRVEDVLRFAAELRLDGATAQQRAARVEATLKLVGLADRRRLRVQRLSGGQRKRVSIAVELITEPEVLFLDEPTSGLDPGLEQQFMGTLRSLAQGQRTVVVTTHVMESMEVVDLLAVVVSGHLAYAGPPAGALEFFEVRELRELFDVLKRRPPHLWSQTFERVRGRFALPPPSAKNAPVPTAGPRAQGEPAARAERARVEAPVATDLDAQLAALKRRVGDGEKP